MLKFRDPSGFHADEYIATLVKVAKVDGVHSVEQTFIERMAADLGVNLKNLPEPAEDLSGLQWPTRVMVYRDAVMLSKMDGVITTDEQAHLEMLASKLGVPNDVAQQISAWVQNYSKLQAEFEKILAS